VKLEGPAKDFQVTTCILSSSERKEESATRRRRAVYGTNDPFVQSTANFRRSSAFVFRKPRIQSECEA
jgi:hypothetical protein